MGDLVNSDFEIHGADDENDFMSDEDIDTSLMDSALAEELLANAKESAIKVNNSFTGPYPDDPLDFNHTDKGPNTQFIYCFDDQ